MILMQPSFWPHGLSPKTAESCNFGIFSSPFSCRAAMVCSSACTRQAGLPCFGKSSQSLPLDLRIKLPAGKSEHAAARIGPSLINELPLAALTLQPWTVPPAPPGTSKETKMPSHLSYDSSVGLFSRLPTTQKDPVLLPRPPDQTLYFPERNAEQPRSP
jgi:hypothetical protein